MPASHSQLYRALLRHFPPPRFLSMPAVGVDISDQTVKFLELRNGKDGVVLTAHGGAPIPEGVVRRGKIEDRSQLISVLRKVKKEYGFEFAHVSLPEEHAYLFESEIPATVKSRGEARQLIEFHMKENVPLSPEEARFDFVPFSEAGKDGFVPVSVSVYPADIVADYEAVFEEARMTPLSFEIEGQAMARAIVPEGKPNATLIVDIGKTGAGIAVVNNGVLAFTATLDIDGDAITKAVASRLEISFAEAERIKEIQGFLRTAENEDVYAAMLGPIVALRDEVHKHVMYWRMYSAEKSFHRADIDAVILCGGNSNLRGLDEYLEATLTLPVSIADVWTNVAASAEWVPPIPRIESLRYATAVGLALRSVERGA